MPVDLTKLQKDIIATDGHVLVIGGPGSGKTTVSILKAAKISRDKLHPGQKVLFLSFARATVSRVLEAIEQESQISATEQRLIEVDTYHAFFWRILQTHGYLIGLPRRITILTPPSEAVALSGIRSEYKADSKLSAAQKNEKNRRVADEQLRLARVEGKVCFDLFALFVGRILKGSNKVRELVSTMYPFIVLDEFQDTSADQWQVVKSLGASSTLIALADPEQRIFDFIGADPARLDHLKEQFHPFAFDLSNDNHRSGGTDIVAFGNDILNGVFQRNTYNGIQIQLFDPNQNQAYSTLVTQTLQARKRLLKSGAREWALAILVPTKRMMRQVSDTFRLPLGSLPAIPHSAAIDMAAAVLAAQVVAFLMQRRSDSVSFPDFVDLLCSYFHGKGGDRPAQSSMNEAKSIRAAFDKSVALNNVGKPLPKKSILVATRAVFAQAQALEFCGNPDTDWRAVRAILETGPCARLKEIAHEARNVRLLDRGTQLRQALSQDWLESGSYPNALEITRQSFVQEHFATTQRPENGVVVMNMHKAKGKQFDEVIIFEGWPQKLKGKIVANPDRILRSNSRLEDLGQARQNFRVSVTRAKSRTTILTPKNDPCALLLPEE